MEPLQDTPALPIALSDSATRQVEIGEEVKDLLKHPGWEHLKAGTATYQRMLTAQLMGVTGSPDASKFNALTGEMKGVAQIEPIARGLIDVGEQARAQMREAEIKEES